jgi:endoglucanase
LVLVALAAVALYRSGHAPADRAARVPNPLAGRSLYAFPDNYARQALQQERDPVAAELIRKIADRPVANWYGPWNADVEHAVRADIGGAGGNELPVLVLYNIPQRDCGQHSAGGAASLAAYRRWVDRFSAGVGTKPAIVVVEPDALAQVDCLSDDQARQRYELVRYAVTRLASNPHAVVYLDAGHARWRSPAVMASRLRAAGVSAADGFSVNVANYRDDAESLTYARALAEASGARHFVIDSSRNGNGPPPDDQWCNPPGRALGTPPAVVTDVPGLDAYLWIKQPGTSDGPCNGGPAAGQWWRQNAIDLAANAA